MQANSLEEALKNPLSIRNLCLRNQRLKKVLPAIWHSFPYLEVLDLSFNQIKTIPRGIVKLKQLKRLIIADNELLKIPVFLGELAFLKVLDVANNHLHTIEALPTSIEVLNLSKNKLKTFPAKILTCSQLLHLDLSHNKLPEIPALNTSLSSLQYVNFSYCGLRNIGLLPTNLRALFLAKNKITSLPSNGQKLTKLQRFDIASNPIKIEIKDDHQWTEVSYIDVRKTKTKWPGISWLLDMFPDLEHSQGGLSRAYQKELSDIIQLCSKKLFSISKSALLKLVKGKNDDFFSEETLGLCLENSVHPDIQAAAFRAYLKKHPFKIKRNIKGLCFAISGEVFQEQQKMKERLVDQGAFLIDNLKEADVVILGYKNWVKLDVEPPKKGIGERALTIWLDKREGRYLTSTKDKTQWSNIERMLKSKDDATFNLAVTLLKLWGTPQSSLVLLLEKWLLATESQKERIKLILQPYLPTEINILLASEEKTVFPLASRGWQKQLWNLVKSR